MNIADEKISPVISILMGVYFPESDISSLMRSVHSILKQTFSDFELLICDDGSSEDAKRYIEQIAWEDERVRIIRKDNLISLSAKLNACLAQAKGKYIARMDDDDYSHPERFTKQLEYLKKHSEVSFVGSNVNLYCRGKLVGKKEFPPFPLVSDFYFTQPYIHPVLMFRRKPLISVNGYSEDKRCELCEDYDLLLRLYALGYMGANIQEILFDYTIADTAKGNRRMIHRWNETVTRYRCFKKLGILCKAFPFVIKPLVVGMLTETTLKRIKESL